MGKPYKAIRRQEHVEIAQLTAAINSKQQEENYGTLDKATLNILYATIAIDHSNYPEAIAQYESAIAAMTEARMAIIERKGSSELVTIVENEMERARANLGFAKYIASPKPYEPVTSAHP